MPIPKLFIAGYAVFKVAKAGIIGKKVVERYRRWSEARGAGTAASPTPQAAASAPPAETGSTPDGSPRETAQTTEAEMRHASGAGAERPVSSGRADLGSRT